MKKFYLLLVVLTVSYINLFGQYFVGQDKIEQATEQNLQSYSVKPADVKNKYVYFESIHTYNYNSDIKVGFDKIEYKSTDEIIITLERGYKNKRDSEAVAITGCGDYLLYLKRGGKSEITLVYKGSGKSVRLGFLLGPQLGPGSGEQRTYIIRFLDKLSETKLKKTYETQGILSGQEIQEFDKIRLQNGSEKVNSLSPSNNLNTEVIFVDFYPDIFSDRVLNNFRNNYYSGFT